MNKLTVGVLMLWIVVAGCTGVPPINPQPGEQIALGDVLAEVAFDQPFHWEFYRDSSRGIEFVIEGGAYRARIANGGFAWAMNGSSHTDVVIQADTLPYSTEADNGYGLACRTSANGNGNGYFFFISSDGAYTIRRGVNGTIEAIVAWATTPAVQTGISPNRIRIACIGDYLALYVNGQFVAEARDSRYQHGYAGIAAVVPEGKAVDVAFDNLTIWEGGLATGEL